MDWKYMHKQASKQNHIKQSNQANELPIGTDMFQIS